jgi:anti-sigma factor RsiW
MQTSHPDLNRCESAEQACAHALQVLPESEVTATEAHIASCPDCQRELESLRAVVGRFVSWPTDVLRPPTSLQGRLALRIAEETGKQPVPPPARQWSEPEALLNMAVQQLAMCYPVLAGGTLRGRLTPRFRTIQVCPKD